jgi:hypothetical protein
MADLCGHIRRHSVTERPALRPRGVDHYFGVMHPLMPISSCYCSVVLASLGLFSTMRAFFAVSPRR